MASAPSRACKCGATIAPGQRCTRCNQGRQQQVDQRRGTSTERGYDSRWRKARAGYLAKHPLCVECDKSGRIVAATDLDHIKPHRGDWDLFWDSSNWQGLCGPCHSRKTAREDGGFGNR